VIDVQWAITRKAKNLLTYNFEAYAGSPQWYLDSNKLYFSCTATAGIRERLWLDKGAYIISFSLDNCTGTLNVGLLDSYTLVPIASASYTTTGAKTLAVTTTYAGLYGLRIYADTGSYTISNLQLESGSSPTTYELPTNGAIAYDDELYGFDGVYDTLDENGMLTKYWQRTTQFVDASGNVVLSNYKAGTNTICVNNSTGETKILAVGSTIATGWTNVSVTVIYQLANPVTVPTNKPRMLVTPGQNYVVTPQMSVVQLAGDAKPEQFTTLHADGLVTQTDPQLLTNKTFGAGTQLGANLDADGNEVINVPTLIGIKQRPMKHFNSTEIPDMKFISLFGNFSGSDKWIGGVLAPNGKIYAIPRSSTQILEIDPNTKTTTLFGGFSSDSGKWEGGVLAPNGKIYAIPYNSTQILEIDPNTQTTTLFGNFSGSDKWVGGVLAPNGKIYAIPFHSTQILEIDPNTQTTTLFGNFSGSYKWVGGVLAPNGKIYAIPFNSTQILEIDPNTQTTTLFGDFSGPEKWIGGVLAPNGKIYAIPFNSTQILEIDPNTQTTTLFGNFSGSYKWSGGVLAPNGKIYAIPYNSTQILEIDPNTQTTVLFGNFSGSEKWRGGVLAPNGKIYAIPLNSTQILEIQIMNYLSPYFNKF